MKITLYPKYVIRSLFVYGRRNFFKAGYKLLYPECSRCGMTPWQHYVIDGKRKGFDNGNHPTDSMFFPEGYELEYPDVKEAGIDPWHHYAEKGLAEGRDNGKNPDESKFFAAGYLEMYPDVASTGIDPWHHYVLYGKAEGRDNGNHPDESKFFSDGYLEMYPEVARKRIDPWRHYVLCGKKEGRNNGLHPGKEQFFAEGYLEMYPDVAKSGLDPWHHYVIHGKTEGRDNGLHPKQVVNKSKFFDVEWMKKRYGICRVAGVSILEFYLKNWQKYKLCPSKGFSPVCYCNDNLSHYECNNEKDPLYHYEIIGKYHNAVIRTFLYQSLKYSKLFNADKYAQINHLNKDVDPVQYYIDQKFTDNPTYVSDYFDELDYLNSNPDVKAAKVKALVHFFNNGMLEGRKGLFPDKAISCGINFKKTLTPQGNKRALLLATYSSDGMLHDDVLYLIKCLKHYVDYIFVVGDCHLIPSELDKLQPLVNFAKFSRHHMYDFGSYKIAWDALVENVDLDEINELLVANDSILGPIDNLDPFFDSFYKETPECDLYGLTLNYFGFKDPDNWVFSAYSPHVQSYFFLASHRLFCSPVWRDFFNKVRIEENKKDIVIKYEMGLSKAVKQNGFKIGYFFKTDCIQNAASNDSYALLDRAFFCKKSMFCTKLRHNSVYNYIFAQHGFPFRISNSNEVYKLNALPAAIYKRPSKITLANVWNESGVVYAMAYIDIVDYKGQIPPLYVLDLDSHVVSQFYSVKCSIENKIYYLITKENSSTATFLFYRLSKKVTLPKRGILFFNYNELQGDNIRLSLRNPLRPGFIGRDYCIYQKHNLCIYFDSSIDSFNSYLIKSGTLWPTQECLLTDISKPTKQRFILFTEKSNMMSDNSFTLFEYMVLHSEYSENCFYIVDDIEECKVLDEKIKGHLVKRNSDMHRQIFIQSRVLVYSYSMNEIVPNSLKEYELSVIYKNKKIFKISHGYTGGYNDSCMCSSFFMGRCDAVATCSSYEYDYFSLLGYKENVVRTGYPRMDKWTVVPEKSHLTIFFTWRRKIHDRFMNRNTADDGLVHKDVLNGFLSCDYVMYCKKVIRCVLELHKFNKINFILHNALDKPFRIIFKAYLEGIFPEINVIDNISQPEDFNDALIKANVLLTDISSVGFDFSYNVQKRAVFLTDPEFVDGHYELNCSFYDQISKIDAVAVSSILELEKTLSDDSFYEFSNKPRNLFYYSDSENCKRCCDVVSKLFNADENMPDNQNL